MEEEVPFLSQVLPREVKYQDIFWKIEKMQLFSWVAQNQESGRTRRELPRDVHSYFMQFSIEEVTLGKDVQSSKRLETSWHAAVATDCNITWSKTKFLKAFNLGI
jgi:hypothetical protein